MTQEEIDKLLHLYTRSISYYSNAAVNGIFIKGPKTNGAYLFIVDIDFYNEIIYLSDTGGKIIFYEGASIEARRKLATIKLYICELLMYDWHQY